MEELDLKWALTVLAQRAEDYERYRDYYEGRQHLAFSTEKFRDAFGHLFKALAYNRCSGVVDAHVDKLIVTGWTLDQAPDDFPDNERIDIETVAGRIWESNRMAIGSRQVHAEELTLGDSYVIVWPGPDGAPVITPQDGDRCVVRYSDERPGVVDLGVKVWRKRDGRWRVNAYYAGHYERYATKKTRDSMPDGPKLLVPFDEDGLSDLITYESIGWAPPLVPMIHFANGSRIGHFGRSELHDVIRLQDGLNKTLADMLVVGEAHSYPQRYAIGILPARDDVTGEDKFPFDPSATSVWWTAFAEGKFGQFESADMRQFVDVLDSWDTKIARVSKVPTHHLGITRDFPSGEALRTAEAPFTTKIRHLQTTLGDAWGQVMTLCLSVTAQDSPGVIISPTWQNPEPRSDQEFWTEATLKIAAGVPKEQIWKEAGYTNDEIEEFKTIKATAVADMQSSINAGIFGLGNETSG